MKLFLIQSLVLAMAFMPVAHAENNTRKIEVVATTTMLSDLVRQIGGERVDVNGLMGPGVDPHLYKPTASDVQKLHGAKIIFYNGLMLEGQMGELFQRVAKSGRALVAVAEVIPAKHILKPGGDGGHADPHVWGDASLWSLCIDPVEKALSGADPEGANYFAKRAGDYRKTLQELDQWAKRRADDLPAERRILITSHDAFNYLGRAYGFQVVGVQGISTVSEAGLADIVKVIDFIKKKEIKAVFVESSVPRAAIERISRDSNAKIGGELFSDALGTPGEVEKKAGETYDKGTFVGMLKHNINTIVEALK